MNCYRIQRAVHWRAAHLKIKRTVEFTSDASQDTLQDSARAQAAYIIIIKNIWLKHWHVDTLTKSNLSIEKFLGWLLFGESNLNTVLVETWYSYQRSSSKSSSGLKVLWTSFSWQHYRTYIYNRYGAVSSFPCQTLAVDPSSLAA